MKVLILTRFSQLGASSRVRFYQYVPYLENHGIQVRIAPLLDDEYLRNLYNGQGVQIAKVFITYLRRLVCLFQNKNYDLLWVDKELFPWMPDWVEIFLARLRKPFVVDYDDALFHRYNVHPYKLVRRVLGEKIDRIMRHARMVIVGNDYLAQKAKQARAKRIEYLPSAINLDKYPLKPIPQNSIFTIGWIGTPITANYLLLIASALREFCKNCDAQLYIIGAEKIKIDGVPMKFSKWTEETEVRNILEFDVGIMPLLDEPWERGKCGYKLIQYLASCRPVIASPVGINRKIIDNGVNGFLANTISEWHESLNILYANRNLRENMGKAGREKVEKEYCLQVTAPRLLSLLNDVV